MNRTKEARDKGDGAQASRNDTVTQQGEDQAPSPRMPHERDESADSQSPEAASTRRMGRLARDAVAAGQTDTDKGPVLDAAYEKQKDSPKQRRQ